MTFKFAIGTILCVILTCVFVPILAQDYQKQLKNYNANIANNEAELRKTMVYKNIAPTVYRPPNVLSIFSEGVEKRLNTSAKIDLGSVPEINTTSTEINPYMSMFPPFDISLILRVVFSTLALLVAYNVISGEREQGTLKLILSNKISRHEILLGKILAGLVILIVPVTIIFVLGLLFLLSFPMIELTVSDWARIGLLYITSLIFISAMYNLGLFFSALMKRSAISLVLGLFAWVIFVVIIPNGSIHLATQIHPLKPEEKIEGQRALAMQEFREKLTEVFRKFPHIRGPKSDAEGAFGKCYSVVCDNSCLQDASKYYPLAERLRINYGDSLWKIELSYFNSLLKQNNLAKNIARISFISSYENAMSILAQSDLTSFQCFMDNAKAYRNNVIEYIRSKTENFASLSYFTICTKGDWEKYQKTKEWKHKKVIETSPLNLQDFPLFTHQFSVAESLKKAIPDIMLLLFFNVLLFILSFVAFIRYDVR